jgi:four helix bundle protein
LNCSPGCISYGGVDAGRGRGSDQDFCRFLWYSNGSCNELEAELLIARDVKLIPEQVHIELADGISEVRRMLTSLIQTLR